MTTVKNTEEADVAAPSALALRNAREIGELSSGYKTLSGEVVTMGREMKEGFSDMHRLIERMGDRMTKPPNTNMWVALVGVIMGAVIGGIPIIATLIYFVVTSTTAPLHTRMEQVDLVLGELKSRSLANFELIVRDDQCLIDHGSKDVSSPRKSP